MAVSIIPRVRRKARIIGKDFIQRNLDLNGGGRQSPTSDIVTNTLFRVTGLDVSGIDVYTAHYLTQMYLDHRFDLLGTGWIEMAYDSKARGLEDSQYQMNIDIAFFDREGQWLDRILLSDYCENSQKIWRLISPDYTPIDWQKDYKSGFRWDEKKWYKEQMKDLPVGVDVKIPWELARLQRLPQMAIFAMVLPDLRTPLINEFRNQILDFIAINPSRMGVNWVCTMDVAIRAANMLLAYDMFTQLDTDEILDFEFKQIFADSIYEHGVHIVNNLNTHISTQQITTWRT